MASNGKASNISEAKGAQLWDETISRWPPGPPGAPLSASNYFKKVIYNKENVCHLTAKLSLHYNRHNGVNPEYPNNPYHQRQHDWVLSLEFLSKWQNPSRLSYEINFGAKRGSEDLTILETAQENLYIKEWPKYQNSLNTYTFSAPQVKVTSSGNEWQLFMDGAKFQFQLKIQDIEYRDKPNKPIQIIGPSMAEAFQSLFLVGKMSAIKIQCKDQ